LEWQLHNLKYSWLFYSWEDDKIDLNKYYKKEIASMLEFKYDTQLLLEGENLDEDEINDYITEHFKGDCLLAVGDEELIKIHFHTNEPWKVLEYCSGLGEIYDIVIEDMDRQSRGLQG
jgi:dihydroxyacetone kinase-like predicted kinase